MSVAIFEPTPFSTSPSINEGPRIYRPIKHRCLRCGDALIRIPRRPIDRLLSVIAPLQRFRCPNFKCQFEGNLRVIAPLRDAPDTR